MKNYSLMKNYWELKIRNKTNTVLLMSKIRSSPVEVGSLSYYYLQGFMHPNGGCLVFSINSISDVASTIYSLLGSGKYKSDVFFQCDFFFTVSILGATTESPWFTCQSLDSKKNRKQKPIETYPKGWSKKYTCNSWRVIFYTHITNYFTLYITQIHIN